MVIKQTICECRELQHAIGIYTFFRRRFGCAPFRLHIKRSAIRSCAHTCACPSKAAQMYFGSMNYATCIYTYSLIELVLTGQPSERNFNTRWIVLSKRCVGYHIFVLTADPSDYNQTSFFLFYGRPALG